MHLEKYIKQEFMDDEPVRQGRGDHLEYCGYPQTNINYLI